MSKIKYISSWTFPLESDTFLCLLCPLAFVAAEHITCAVKRTFLDPAAGVPLSPLGPIATWQPGSTLSWGIGAQGCGFSAFVPEPQAACISSASGRLLGTLRDIVACPKPES